MSIVSLKFVSTFKASVNSRLSHYEECEAFLMASALDPQFKLKWSSSVEYNSLKANFVWQACSYVFCIPAMYLTQVLYSPGVGRNHSVIATCFSTDNDACIFLFCFDMTGDIR